MALCKDCSYYHRGNRRAVGGYGPCLHPRLRRIVAGHREPDDRCPLKHDGEGQNVVGTDSSNNKEPAEPDPDGGVVARLFEEQRAFMARVAWSHTHNRQDAEDIVQEAAVRLLEQRRIPADRRALAYTLTDHAAHQWLEWEHRHCRDSRLAEPLDPSIPRHHGSVPSAERDALGRIELAEVCSRAPASARAIAAGYTYREIEEASGRKLKALFAEVSRWRQKEAAAV